MIDKKKINTLIPIANSKVECIRVRETNNTTQTVELTNKIPKEYNGKIAAFSVSIAMSGLLPTLAMYRKEDNTISDTRKILGIISKIIEDNNSGYNFEFNSDNNGEGLVQFAITNNSPELRSAIIHCAIALKLVIRTYELK